VECVLTSFLPVLSVGQKAWTVLATKVILNGVLAPTHIPCFRPYSHIYVRRGEKIPLQRWGEKADIANATVFLFSKAANFISGQVLAVDGGDYHTNGSSHPYPDSILNPKSRL
jgi:Enoyl-(Acyl carrier protein) reductase